MKKPCKYCGGAGCHACGGNVHNLKFLLPFLFLFCFLSCKDKPEPTQFLHTTTFQVKLSNGDIDTVSCEYRNDVFDKQSYLLKEGCLKCGQFYYFMESVACNVSTYEMISDTAVVYDKQEQNE